MAQRASTGRAGVVSPPTLDTPHTGEDATRRNVWPLLAVAAIIALLSTNGLAWYLLYSDDPPPPSPSSTAPATSDSTAAPESTDGDLPTIDPPEDRVYGTFEYRGNSALTGETSGGFRTLLGSYWEPVAPGGFLQSDLVSYGRFLYVASETRNAVFALDQSDGTTRFTLETDGHLWTGPVVASFTRDLGPEGTETVQRLIVVSEDGTLYSRSASGAGSTGRWTRELKEEVRAAPVVADGKIVVATAQGSILAIDADGQSVWRYPMARTDRPAFRSSPAIEDGTVYAVDGSGFLHMVSIETGLPICDPIRTAYAPSSASFVADGLVFLPTDGVIMVYEVSSDPCGAKPYLIPTNVDSAIPPAYANGRLFSIEGASVVAWNIAADEDGGLKRELAWELPYLAESNISTAPIVAEGVVYFGTNDGIVHAIDALTGASLWTFPTGERVHGGPVIAANAVFVTTEREVFSIAGE